MRHYFGENCDTFTITRLALRMSQTSRNGALVLFARPSARLLPPDSSAFQRTVDIAPIAVPTEDGLLGAQRAVEDSITGVQVLERKSSTKCFLPCDTGIASASK